MAEETENTSIVWPNKLIQEHTGAFGIEEYTSVIYVSDLIEPIFVEKEDKKEEKPVEDTRNIVEKTVNFNDFIPETDNNPEIKGYIKEVLSSINFD